MSQLVLKTRRDHPFGREEEASARCLSKFFSNCVFLGHWELAAACVKQLTQSTNLNNFDVFQELLTIACNPYGTSLGGDGLLSPHHQSWLCIQSLLKHDITKSCKTLAAAKDDVEFRILLLSLQDKVQANDSILQELYSFHLKRTRFSSWDPSLADLSSRCISLLQTILIQHQHLAFSLFDKLFSNRTKPQNTSHKTAKLQLKVLNRLLADVHEPSADSILKLCQLFSHFCSNQQIQHNQEDITALMAQLIELCRQAPHSRSVVYSSMFNLTSIPFLKKFLRLEFTQTISEITLQEQNLDEEVAFMLGLPEQDLWRHLFFYCLNKEEHFADVVLKCALHLLATGDVGRIARLVRPFPPLRLLVLVVCWDHCTDIETASALLTALSAEPEEATGLNAVLSRLCDQLSFQMELIQHALQWARSELTVHGSQLPPSSKTLFLSLEAYSSLQIINLCLPLHLLSPSRVIDFIASTPRPLANESNQSKKSVTFHISCEESEAPDLHAPPVSWTLEADVALFRCFCAIKAVMDAVSFCSDAEAWSVLETSNSRKTSQADRMRTVSVASMQSARNRSLRPRNLSSLAAFSMLSMESASEVRPLNDDLQVLKDLYSVKVMQRLEEAKDHLSRVFPLIYRIEIAENIFSLLFATHEDVQELVDVKYRCSCEQSDEDLNETKVSSHETQGGSEKSNRSSNHSNHSAGDHHKIGFITNEFVTRDVLQMLKDVLLNLSADVYAVHENQTQTEVQRSPFKQQAEKHLAGIINCSLDCDELQSRLKSLTKLVHEATWRLQLVVKDCVTEDYGQLASSSQSHSDSDEKDMNDVGSIPRRRRRASRKRTSSISSQDGRTYSGGSELATDGSASGGASHKRSRGKQASRKYRHSAGLLFDRKGVVPQMLSSPETLLNLCLERGRFTQAQQVQKLYNIECSLSTHEISFNQQYASAVRKLRTQSYEGMKSASKSVEAEQGQRKRPLSQPSLTVIASKAARGIASLSVSSVVDHLLSLSSLPSFSPVTSELPEALSISKHINSAHVPAMIIVDLTCVASNHHESCISMLEMANRRMDEDGSQRSCREVRRPPGSKQVSPCPVLGIKGFTQKMQMLVNLAKDENAKAQHKRSLCSALNCITAPLDAEMMKMHVSAAVMLQREFSRADEALQQMHKEIAAQTTDSFRVLTTRKPLLRMAVKSLIEGCRRYVPPQGLHQLLLCCPEQKSGTEFLRVLYDYVRNLSTFISQFTESDVGHLEYFSILRESPERIMGSLIFRQLVPPSELIRIASQIHVKLSHVIISHCCPRIPSTPRVNFQKFPSTDNDRTRPVVLNSGQALSAQCPFHPEIIVRHILTNLVKLMRDAAQESNQRGIFDFDAACFVIESGQHSSVLQRTQLLQHADVSLLSSEEDRLCFYANLTNLLTLHALLAAIEGLMQRENCLTDSSSFPVNYYGIQPSCLHAFLGMRPSALNDLTWQMGVAYSVGQLGTVRLFDLRHVILRKGLKPSGTMSSCLVNYSLDLHLEDPWHKHGLLHADNHLIFVLTDGHLSSPCLKILSPELVKYQLMQACKEFLTATVRVNREERKVHIHPLLNAHQRDFISLIDDSSDQEDFQREALTQFLLSFAEGELADDLDFILNVKQPLSGIKPFLNAKTLDVTVDNPQSAFGFIFDMDVWVHFLPPFRSSSVDLDSSAFLSLNPSILLAPPRATLTPPSLEFLKSESEMLAVLVSLVADREDKPLPSDVTLPRCVLDYLECDRSCVMRNASPDFRSGPFIKSFSRSPLSSPMKNALLASSNGHQYLQFAFSVIENLLAEKCWQPALAVLTSVSFSSVDASWQLLHDCILCCAVHSSAFISDDEIFVPSLIARISCLSLRQRTVLANLEQWEVKDAVMILRLCLTEDCDDELSKLVNATLKRMLLYQQIADCSRNLLLRLSTSAKHDDGESIDEGSGVQFDWTFQFLEQLCSWQEIVQVSRDDPAGVLTTLLQCNEHSLAQTWSEIFDVKAELKQLIAESQCLWLLEREEPDLSNTSQLLDNLQLLLGTAACVSLCEGLLEKLKQCHNTLFIADYLLNVLKDELTEEQISSCRLISIGCKALLCLPEKARPSYIHLVASPLLLLEQLLMNSKVEWSGLVLSSVRDNLKSHSSGSGLNCLNADVLDDLLITYAHKALEFCVVEINGQTPSPRSQSRMSMTSLPSQTPVPHFDSSRRFLSERPLSIQKSEALSLRFGRSAVPQRAQSSAAGLSLLHDVSPAAAQPFVMPAEPPSKEQWVPDEEASVCMVCQVERFSMFTRRHHCRRCGRVVCDACSRHTAVIRGNSVRICDDCHQAIYKPRSDEGQDRLRVLRDRISSLSSPGTSPAIFPRSPGNVESGEGATMDHSGLGSECQHLMTLDDEQNSLTREEFYYDSAPSTSLCLSILQLHKQNGKCANVLLEMCDYVSRFLRPSAPGLSNPEVDYSFVISIVKYLVMHAKVKFVSCGDNTGISRCEMYSDRIQLLERLVSSGSTWVPSIESVMKTDTLRRLRDQLIREELYAEAMDLSTKCGLDASGVWISWGMVCLKDANLSLARLKFEKVLKVPIDRHQQAPKVIVNIVECLEYLPDASSASCLADRSLDHPFLQEALRYLCQYGSHTQCIGFYQRHNALSKAVQYIYDKRVNADVFIEALLLPSFSVGQFSRLTDALVTSDPSLAKWDRFLSAACSYLMKARKNNMLYILQLFMKDFIRAAMTCITLFYIKGASTYVDLQSRMHHLLNARHHLESFLDKRQWSQIPKPQITCNASTPQVRKTMSSQEVNKYIHTIGLQIEVTKFMHRYHDNYMRLAIAHREREPSASLGRVPIPWLISRSGEIISLFGSTQMKSEVAFLIIISGNNVHDGFGLAFRLIQDFKLDAMSVYKQAGIHFTQHHQMNFLNQLLECAKQSGMCSDQQFDDIIRASVDIIAKHDPESATLDDIIRMMHGEVNKINAYLSCGKLKFAFVLAAKLGRTDDVRFVHAEAVRVGPTQSAVKNICEKYFEQKGIEL